MFSVLWQEDMDSLVAQELLISVLPIFDHPSSCDNKSTLQHPDKAVYLSTLLSTYDYNKFIAANFSK